VHAFPVITQNITNIRTRGRSNIYSITTKNLQICCRKKWNSYVFLHSNLFHRKKAKKEPKGQNNFLRPTNLRRSQKRPKSQLKHFKPTNLERGQISEIWLKKTNLATLLVPEYQLGYLDDDWRLFRQFKDVSLAKKFISQFRHSLCNVKNGFDSSYFGIFSDSMTKLTDLPHSSTSV